MPLSKVHADVSSESIFIYSYILALAIPLLSVRKQRRLLQGCSPMQLVSKSRAQLRLQSYMSVYNLRERYRIK